MDLETKINDELKFELKVSRIPTHKSTDSLIPRDSFYHSKQKTAEFQNYCFRAHNKLFWKIKMT